MKIRTKVIAVLASTGLAFSNVSTVNASLSGKLCAAVDVCSGLLTGEIGYFIFKWEFGNRSVKPDQCIAATVLAIMTVLPTLCIQGV